MDDFVMAKMILNSGVSADWTVAIGLYNMLQKTLINNYFALFCAGGVLVSIPISILFVIMQSSTSRASPPARTRVNTLFSFSFTIKTIPTVLFVAVGIAFSRWRQESSLFMVNLISISNGVCSDVLNPAIKPVIDFKIA